MTTNTPEGNAFRADNDGSSDALMRVYPLDGFLYKCYVFHSSERLYQLLCLAGACGRRMTSCGSRYSCT